MIFSADGIIQKFLDLLGVTVTTSTGQYIVFVISSAFCAVCVVSLMLLFFKFLVYLRKG